jgi:hypothetical protein
MEANSEGGSIMFFRNVGVHLPEDTVSNSRRPKSKLSSRDNVTCHTNTSSEKNIPVKASTFKTRLVLLLH